MAEWAELLVNAATGVGGALVGGFFSLHAARESHRKTRAAARDDAAKQARELDQTRAWLLTQNTNEIASIIKGIHHKFAHLRAKHGPLGDDDLWKILVPGVPTNTVPNFSSDELRALFPVGANTLIGELLDLQSRAKGLEKALEVYSERRSRLEDEYALQLASGERVEELIKSDVRFLAVSNIAKAIWHDSKEHHELSVSICEKLISALRPLHDEMGFKAVNLPVEPSKP